MVAFWCDRLASEGVCAAKGRVPLHVCKSCCYSYFHVPLKNNIQFLADYGLLYRHIYFVRC